MMDSVRTSQTTYYVCLPYEPNRLMLSIGLWPWYINVTVSILDIIHRPLFYFKHDVSETVPALRLYLLIRAQCSEL
jgi:hypothetical protein